MSGVATHRALVGVFLGEGSGRAVVVLTAAAALVRTAAGPIGPFDVFAVVVVALVFPFVEWCIHTYVLHKAPGRLGPIPFDPSRAHRHHHRDPGDARWMMLRWFQAGFYGVVIGAGAFAVVGGLVSLLGGDAVGAGATAALAGIAGLAAYEWLHLLFHSGVTPRMRWVRTMRARHRLHHWRNEWHWMGVTSSLGDRVLGTLPADAADVPRSDTARAPELVPTD